MNRLVIIGNGFDLAHGLPTGYCDFINNFWKNIKSYFKRDNYTSLIYINDSYSNFLNYGPIASYEDFRSNMIEYAKEYGYKYERGMNHEKCYVPNGADIFYFKSDLFRIINKNHVEKNWVDIENEYYQLLKKSLAELDNSSVKKLNQEFNDIKTLLEDYLINEVLSQYNFSMPNELHKLKQIFNIWNRFTEKDNFIQEFSGRDKDEVEFYTSLLKRYNSSGFTDIRNYINKNGMQVKNLFLNFNYTVTLDAYLQELINDDLNYYGESTLIQIHGRINDSNNKINFGFGDEMDGHYKLIEEKDDNEYLKNIKSFQYLQNTNYKRFLDFIESKEFQVYIMGHSCGLSDRILLNTIFEHPNCKSIKVFFYEKEGSNNYTEIVQNISRHFNKKKLMREKIVNKSLCQPLPQNVRFAKQATPRS